MKRLLVVSALAATFTASEPPAIADAASSLGGATRTTTMVLPDEMEVVGSVLFSDFNSPANVVDVPK